MKQSIPVIFVFFFLALVSGCSDSTSENTGQAASPGEAVDSRASESVVTTENGITTVRMTGNDQMKYNINEFSVKTGDTVRLVFENVGKMPKSAMGHNVVFLTAETNVNGFVTASAQAKANDYIPSDRTDEIIAHTELLGPGESDTIEFTAPEPGEYDYVCSFPAHAFAGMRGVMTVTP